MRWRRCGAEQCQRGNTGSRQRPHAGHRSPPSTSSSEAWILKTDDDDDDDLVCFRFFSIFKSMPLQFGALTRLFGFSLNSVQILFLNFGTFFLWILIRVPFF
ncbi:unnamed protein product [Caenorhabditis auriculariae]|uniref:Uncharacterized protein n=1 Tax=Caenorhabditis auriculariae TaxID=2777116 RepID=A0A8S1GZJ6_9PELO|nr:unnamed protein product [Caenorhabditis auriculariae]